MNFSIWEKQYIRKDFDVIICGAGFSGSWLAYFLMIQKPKLRILIVEKSYFSDGASTKNAGFACFGSPSELLENINHQGAQMAMDLAGKRFEGIQLIKSHFRKNIEYDECGGFELFETNYDQYQHEVRNLNKTLQDSLGITNHFKEDNDYLLKCGFKGFEGCIRNEAEGSLNPVLLLQRLHETIQKKGVKILFHTEVKSVHDSIVNCDLYGNFTAKHIIVCTNAFSDTLTSNLNIKPGRGQMLATSVIPNLKIKGTFHFDKGYYYFKNYQNRIIIGGGRNLDFEKEQTTLMEENPTITKKIVSYLKENILPTTFFEVADKWTGIMAFNESKEPVSKIINQQLSYNVCMNGMGVALAPLLGKNLAKSISDEVF